MKARRTWRSLALALAGSLLLTGCGGAEFDVYELPLPGGADVGDDPIEVTVAFRDVLDLVPKSTVKVDDVTVGQVSDISLDGFAAEVTMTIRGDLDLPENTVAEIRQTSLLGEKFVELAAPETGAEGSLDDGEEIPLERTGRNPEVEEVLGALSLVLNGGGVAQLKTITVELNKTLEGREDVTKDLLTQVDSFMGQLDANKADIVDAIESLNQLSISVRQQQPSIDRALEQLPSALDSLDRQRDDLVRMLTALDDLSDVGVGVIRRSKAVTIQTLQRLQPVLTQLSNSGDAFVDAFNVFLTYPFVDEVVGRDPQVARNIHMGDYTNLAIRFEVDLSDPLTDPPDLGLPCNIVGSETEALTEALDQIFEQTPDLPLADALEQALQQLDPEGVCDGLSDLVNNCNLGGRDRNNDGIPDGCLALLEDLCGAVGDLTGIDLPFCTEGGDLLPLDQLEGLLDGLLGGGNGGLLGGGGGLLGGGGNGGGGGGNGGGGNGGGGNGGGGGGGNGGGGGLLGGLFGNRAAFGDTRTSTGAEAGRGPTLGQLTEVYDPALTTLLVPGMVTR